MPVRFQNTRVSDKALPSNIENVHKFFHAFAGIHEMEFDDAFSMSHTGWTTDAGLTILTQELVPLYDDQVSKFDNNVKFQ